MWETTIHSLPVEIWEKILGELLFSGAIPVSFDDDESSLLALTHSSKAIFSLLASPRFDRVWKFAFDHLYCFDTKPLLKPADFDNEGGISFWYQEFCLHWHA
ncbi:MAG: hypothetical protein SGCHY_004552, partial [Lobulomycetales sp.]